MVSSKRTRRSIFRDKTVLTDTCTPEIPVARDRVKATLHKTLQPIVHRKPADNVVLVGAPGTGKTTVVAHVLDKIESNSRVSTAMINCWQYQTRPALLAELLIQLGYPAPRKGTPVDARLTTFQELLAKSDGLIVALDEFDQFTHQTEIIYDLQDAVAQTDQELGLILVGNQPPASLDLDPRSHSRLDCRIVSFEPYTADELAVILHHRIEAAFRRGVITPAAVDRIANTVADAGGDCRQALSLLLRAGRIAEREQAPEVTVDHVEQACSRSPNL